MPDPVTGLPAVELRGAVKRFGSFTALKKMDLSIRQGEFFTLLGASGCGKTTTLRLIAGFELPSEGQVLIAGQDVSDVPAYQRPVHTVFQNYALFPHLNILENVGFPLRVRGLPKAERQERAKAALDLVQMGAFSDRKPSQLSGGQQQRVALARALVNEPKVLLLDEPLGALDLKLRKEMQAELKAMQRRLGITFVFVTHDQEEALAMSDRIALMHGGEIVQLDSPTGVYDTPVSLYAAEFIGETNLIPARVIEVGPNETSLVALGAEMRAPLRTDALPGASVTLTIRPERVSISGVDQPNSAEGLLLGVDFIGTDLRLIYEMADGIRVTLRRQNTGGPIPEPGQTARLGFDPASLRLFNS